MSGGAPQGGRHPTAATAADCGGGGGYAGGGGGGCYGGGGGGGSGGYQRRVGSGSGSDGGGGEEPDDVADATGARRHTLTRRYSSLMVDASLADFVVVVNGRRYPCVRSVLVTGSTHSKAPFFAGAAGAGAVPVSGEVTLEGVSVSAWEAVRF